MSKAKMKFPPVPGDTPREKFINLVRHVISLPKKIEKPIAKRPDVSKPRNQSEVSR